MRSAQIIDRISSGRVVWIEGNQDCSSKCHPSKRLSFLCITYSSRVGDRDERAMQQNHQFTYELDLGLNESRSSIRNYDLFDYRTTYKPSLRIVTQ